MKSVRFRSWSRFKKEISGWLAFDSPKWQPVTWWFRGHADAAWKLQPTLDRSQSFADTDDRNEHSNRLLSRFREELIGFGPSQHLPGDPELELFARHHGLPSPLMDWTLSPYIAAFFAFAEVPSSGLQHAAIWALDSNMATLLIGDPEPVDFIVEREMLRFNVRALEQRGVFLRVNVASPSVEELLDQALVKIELPAKIRREALTDLYEMGITPSKLFRDPDGAARTAQIRHLIMR